MTKKVPNPANLIFLGEAPPTPRQILEKCEELAREYFDSTGDVMAVAHSLRNVILARFEWVAKHGKDAGE
jgi:hypothetical protein